MTPDEHTNQEFFLDVGDGHQLYVHDWGNPAAEIPIVFLHGGPGNGCADRHKSTFDPFKQRVIFHDQRGAGKSLPLGSLENNTTPHLVGDIEKIAQRLALDTFVITGGSWGSTLALAYGIEHPKRLVGMVIQGVFMGTHDDINWLDQGRFREFFPDAWERYLAATPREHQADPSAYHFKRALDSDEQAAKASAYVYGNLESSLVKLDDRFQPKDFETYDPIGTRIEIHYIANHCFMPDRHILKNAGKLTMPVWIVQGRYDMVCRPAAAYELHQQLPKSKFTWTINGHLAEHEAANILSLAHQHFTGDL